MKLSVVIITKNEERNIERCLKSIIEVADEIIVVDSFSKDKTIEFCEKYNAKIFQRKFDGYGDQKQFATEQASSDYILSLDADEELSETLKKSILAAKKNLEFDYYSFNRRNFYCNTPIRFCGFYPDKKVRLFNRLKTNWNNKVVHESVEVSDKKNICHLKGDLNHYTCTTIDELYEKEKKYAQMNADILHKKGKSISIITPFVKGGFRFLKSYIFMLGILDGYYGFLICKSLGNSSFLKYYLAMKLNNKNRN